MNGIQEIQTCADAPNVSPFIGIENAKPCGKHSMKKKYWDDEKISILDNYLRSDNTYEEISLLMGKSIPALRHAKSRLLRYPDREKRPYSMNRRVIQDVKNGTRKCNICGRDTPFELLVKNSKRRSGYDPRCKSCRNDLDLKNLKTVQIFGLSKEGYLKMLVQQGGVCAICKKTPNTTEYKRRLCIDHNHLTGGIRGLLCSHCNAALGLLHDDVGLVQAVADYLIQTQ